MAIAICGISVFAAGLGFFSLIMDVLAINAQHTIWHDLPIVCGVDSRGFFMGCFALQLALFLLAQCYLSVSAMHRYRNQGAGAMLLGGVLGLLRLEVAWLQGSTISPSSDVLERILTIKVANLVFEAPQLVTTFVSLQARESLLAFSIGATHNPDFGLAGRPENLAKSLDLGPDSPAAVQVLTLVAGILTLSLAATELALLHPQSFWAVIPVPEKLPLALLPFASWRAFLTWCSSVLSLTCTVVQYSLAAMLWSGVQILSYPSAGLLTASILLPWLGGAWMHLFLLFVVQNKASHQAFLMGMISAAVNVPWIKGQPGETWKQIYRAPWQAICWSVLSFCTVMGLASMQLKVQPADNMRGCMIFNFMRDTIENPRTTVSQVLASSAYAVATLQFVSFVLLLALVWFAWKHACNTKSSEMMSQSVTTTCKCELLGIPISMPAVQWDYEPCDDLFCSHLVKPGSANQASSSSV